MVMGRIRVEHTTYLTRVHVTLVRAGAGKRLGGARLQQLLAATQGGTEGRPCQSVLLHALVCMVSGSGNRPGMGTWATSLLATTPS